MCGEIGPSFELNAAAVGYFGSSSNVFYRVLYALKRLLLVSQRERKIKLQVLNKVPTRDPYKPASEDAPAAVSPPKTYYNRSLF